MNTFKDIFKKSFLEGYSSSDISIKTVIVTLLITALIALYVFAIYRLVTRKTFYSKNFNISIFAVAVITATIILTIQSSIVVSLGMVGALSIVRFRTAIKDPMDLVFLFWSISIGIVCGAGFAEYAIVLSVLLTVFILIFDKIPLVTVPSILIINADNIETEAKIEAVLSIKVKHYIVKSRNITKKSVDYIYELRTKDDKELLSELMKIDGIINVSLMDHDGEATY